MVQPERAECKRAQAAAPQELRATASKRQVSRHDCGHPRSVQTAPRMCASSRPRRRVYVYIMYTSCVDMRICTARLRRHPTSPIYRDRISQRAQGGVFWERSGAGRPHGSIVIHGTIRYRKGRGQGRREGGSQAWSGDRRSRVEWGRQIKQAVRREPGTLGSRVGVDQPGEAVSINEDCRHRYEDAGSGEDEVCAVSMKENKAVQHELTGWGRRVRQTLVVHRR